MAKVVVAGLGPGPVELVPAGLEELAASFPAVLLRTSRHPSAAAFSGYPSLDHLYERAASFAELYPAVVEAIVDLASRSGELLYLVPGSPLVAERTVALLREERSVELELRPAMSFLDLAWSRLGVDPVAVGARLVDAVDFAARPSGPGPVLITQAWSRPILSELKLAVDDLSGAPLHAVFLHHLGLDDEVVTELPLDALDRALEPDHLTSVWIPVLPSAGPPMESLVALMATLRERCPWDAEQTHGSLARHLVEEAYEVVEVLDAIGDGVPSDEQAAALEEELGDLLFQVVFHAHLAAEVGAFNLGAVATQVEAKLVTRHPHVFEGAAVAPDGAVAQWERIKQAEKGRASVTDGIAPGLPALSLVAKLRSKGEAVGLARPSIEASSERLASALARLDGVEPELAVAEALAAVADLAAAMGVDAESVLRRVAAGIRDEVLAFEGR